ncbi:radical SAM protein [Candidatus Termititenax dinenymphae]|uniref:Radical SAM protein n=1 Tax=Candidatus Termititenax dinenymphae TaxID=2218523 RepID=A0A388TJM1_9BACT|nr:radical SAM protein [Candidatus Termititenax dinenymphae]
MLQPRFENLELDAFCELLCPDCQAWQERESKAAPAVTTRSGIINLTGGNPLNHPELNKILIDLKNQKRFITLTTCGYNLADFSRQLLLIDLLLLYIPGFSQERATFEAGFNAVSRQESIIEYLQEIKKKFAVLYPIDSETIEDLPDLYHKLNKRNSFLILLYNKNSELPLQRVDKKYLYYYGNKRNSLVYEYASTGSYNCLDFSRNFAKFSFYNLRIMLKLFYKLYF